MNQKEILSKIINLNHQMNNRVLYYDIIEAIINCDLSENSNGTIQWGFLNRHDLIQGKDDNEQFRRYVSGKSFKTSKISELDDNALIWFSEDCGHNEFHLDILPVQEYVDWFIFELKNFIYDDNHFKQLSVLLF